MLSLNELANKYMSDKGTVRGAKHGYTFTYDHYFNHMRDKNIKILEIGLDVGGPELGGARFTRIISNCPSIKMWHDYFTNGQIWGFDVNGVEPSLLESLERFNFFKGDQGSTDSLENFKKNVKNEYKNDYKFDIIIDDGSHAFYHQQLAFALLSEMVKPGGYYVIEDVHWQPNENRGGGKAGGGAVYDSRKLPNTVPTTSLFGSSPNKGALEFLEQKRPEIFKGYSKNREDYKILPSNPTGNCRAPSHVIVLQKKGD